MKKFLLIAFVVSWHVSEWAQIPCDSRQDAWTGHVQTVNDPSYACFHKEESDRKLSFKTKAEATQFMKATPQPTDRLTISNVKLTEEKGEVKK